MGKQGRDGVAVRRWRCSECGHVVVRAMKPDDLPCPGCGWYTLEIAERFPLNDREGKASPDDDTYGHGDALLATLREIEEGNDG